MKKNIIRHLFILLFFNLAVVSCIGVNDLRTSPAVQDDITGSFDVIFYYDANPDNLKKVAILDISGDGYRVSVYDTHYNIREAFGVEADEAFERGVKHVKGHLEYDSYRISRIHALDGSTVGFEIRPLYEASKYGMSDVLDIRYVEGETGDITAYIRLQLPLQMRFDAERFEVRNGS